MEDMFNGDDNMSNLTATFEDGTTITRKTKKDYKFAWKQTWTVDGVEHSDSGFSMSIPKGNPSWALRICTNDREVRMCLTGEKMAEALRRNKAIRETIKTQIVKVGA